MTVKTRFDATVPEVFTGKRLFEAFLTSEVRRAMNEVMEDLRTEVQAKTVIFRGVTRRGWKRTEAKRFGRSFIASFYNEEITANILEYGAPDHFRGTSGFGSPPPVESRTAGAGRTILDWVQEVDPVLVGDIESRMSDKDAFGLGGAYSKRQQAARKAAFKVAGSIYKRGLPSASNRSSLLMVNQTAAKYSKILSERVSEAVGDTFRKLRLPRRL